MTSNSQPLRTSIAEATPFTQVLIDMVPTNPVAAMADGQMLPIIFFAVLLGISITLSKEVGTGWVHWFHDMNAIIMKLVTLVMRFAPYGVFALIAILAATSSADSFLALGKYVGLVFAVLFIHALIVYPMILSVLGRLSPLKFLFKLRAAMLFAFTTASSNATIPVTLETVEKKDRRQQQDRFIYRAAGCDHQYGWHGHHAGYRDGVYRPILWY